MQTSIAMDLRSGDRLKEVNRKREVLVRSKAARITSIHRIITNKGYGLTTLNLKQTRNTPSPY